MLELHKLKYFAEVARHQHIGRAAKILAISPSAVWHAVDDLEKQLELKLFEKVGRSIVLTENGQRLLEKSEELLLAARHLELEFLKGEAVLAGNYKVAATHGLASYLIFPSWGKLKQTDMKLEVSSQRSANVIDAIVRGQYDMGLCYSPLTHPDLDIEVLKKGQLVFCVSKKHPILEAPQTKQKQLIGQYQAALPIALHGIDDCEHHPVFKKLGIKVTPELAFDNYETGADYISKSQAWGFFPDWIVEQQKQRLCVVPGLEEFIGEYKISAVWNRKRTRKKALEELCKLVVDDVRFKSS